MNESDLLAGVPDWAKYLGGTSGVLIAVSLWLRQWLSSAKVDRTADEATSNTLRTLQEQLAAERTRADGLMHEREAMAQEIGQLHRRAAGTGAQAAGGGRMTAAAASALGGANVAAFLDMLAVSEAVQRLPRPSPRPGVAAALWHQIQRRRPLPVPAQYLGRPARTPGPARLRPGLAGSRRGRPAQAMRCLRAGPAGTIRRRRQRGTAHLGIAAGRRVWAEGTRTGNAARCLSRRGWSPGMTPLALRLRVGLRRLVGSQAGCAWLGWTLRDRSADLAVASAQAAQQASRADTAQAAHQQDLANARAGARAESQRLATQAERTQQFNALQRDIDTHAKTPGRDRGDADAEFLQTPPELPDLQGADDDALLRNHVAVARRYHELADQLRALLCSLGNQRGFTINGALPVAPASCGAAAGASRTLP
ncbi:hypothetical protein G6F31_013321 [Rhizopus arrhizus]|nr:hypothetical protein G6F31_013321 [Rhizopus arrhizus]